MLKNLAPLILILLLGAGLRFHALAQDARFHPDEALFATFARRAAVNGDWLLHGALDKTPLSIYADALWMMLVGVTPLPNGVLTLDVHAGEFAARIPGVMASILLMAAMYAAAKDLYLEPRPPSPSPYMDRGSKTGQQSRFVALIALFLTAVSPYAVAFSATVFTDGLMLLCVTLALWMGGRGRAGWAGVWLAVGFACKQQAIFYVPLVAVVIYLTPRPPLHKIERGSRTAMKPLSIIWRGVWGEVLKFILPLLICLVLLLILDNARGQESSVFALAAANNDPRNLITRWEFIPRLFTWAGYLGHMAGAGWLTGLLLMVALVTLGWRVVYERRERATWIDLLLLLFCLGYMAFHLIVAFPTHDRYPLLLLPPLLLLIARGLEWAGKGVTQRFGESERQRIIKFFAALFLCFSVIIFLPSVLDAAEGRIGGGGDQGEHAGVDDLGAYLESKPLGTIIYDHWLGWELGYYLGTWSDKRLTYYPQPILLAEDARIQADPAPRYFVAPMDAPVRPWLDALRAAGFTVRPDYRTERQTVYRLTRET